MKETALVVREPDEFSRILTAAGLAVVNCPAIETAPVHENLHALAAKISARRYDGIFLTSRTATDIAVSEIFCENFSFDGIIYLLGKSSYERLKDSGFELFFDDRANTAREMLEAIPPAALEGKKFLFLRGEKSLGTVTEFLRARAALDEEIVYRTRPLAIGADLKNEIGKRAARGAFACACFFSPSGAESFVAQLGAAALERTKVATIGATTAAFFAGIGRPADFVAARATAADFAAGLLKYLKAKKEK